MVFCYNLTKIFKGVIMIDLHTHSLFSDGVLLPSELVRRAREMGYTAIAITDHVDVSNLDFVLPRIIKASQDLNKRCDIFAIPGVEITHVPPDAIKELAREARRLGAKIIVVHGETIKEPVMAGTNRSAIEADIDILAHPGLISHEDVRLAKGRGIYLEITARPGHSFSNGHVAKLAIEEGAQLILNTDTHEPSDLITGNMAEKILFSAGLNDAQVEQVFKNSKDIVKRIREVS